MKPKPKSKQTVAAEYRTLLDELAVETALEQVYTSAAGEVVREVTGKQQQYGNAFAETAKILAIIYPDGVRPEQLQTATIITRMLDRVFQLARAPIGQEARACSALAGLSLLCMVETRAELRSRLRNALADIAD
jgi:hypothetical protein